MSRFRRQPLISARRLLLIALLLFLLPGFAFAVDSPIPSSPCSLDVFHRVAPTLRRQLRKHGLRLGSPIFIRIFKMESDLEVWVATANRFKLFKRYTICDFSGFLGPKQKEGDMQTPEGFYTVGPDQMNPWSHYHLAFNLGYPNLYDQLHRRTGSNLMVHGRCSSIGCFAMADSRMDEIYTLADAALENGQKHFDVHIYPFRMTAANLHLFRYSKWLPFWKNLKEGYDIFEKKHIPPTVTVADDRYLFNRRPLQQITMQENQKNGKP